MSSLDTLQILFSLPPIFQTDPIKWHIAKKLHPFMDEAFSGMDGTRTRPQPIGWG
jgi:hypothetical protein